MQAGYAGPGLGSVRRWPWWPARPRSRIHRRGGGWLLAGLPQLLPCSPKQPFTNPTRQTEPGVLGCPAEQVQLIRLQPHVEGGGVLVGALSRLAHAAMVDNRTDKVNTMR